MVHTTDSSENNSTEKKINICIFNRTGRAILGKDYDYYELIKSDNCRGCPMYSSYPSGDFCEMPKDKTSIKTVPLKLPNRNDLRKDEIILEKFVLADNEENIFEDFLDKEINTPCSWQGVYRLMGVKPVLL